jgi:23S rRNA (guanine2445-N2)-methyltransferase / 23S rRNA (guanine2069-N7)-methyltransferase
MPVTYRFFATAARGTESLLAGEISDLGGMEVDEHRAGVAFAGTLEAAYRTCLWSRVASRLLLPLESFTAANPTSLYEGVRSIDWRDHLGRRATLAVDCNTARSRITHSHFAALKTKDAIVDQLRDRTGVRPSIDTARPSVRVNVHLHQDQATVSIDLSGESLHRRNYRASGAEAPLKENLAASVLLLVEWPRLARERVPFLDPMCGSGTLPIEAALMAGDIAPGAARTYFGFLGWRGHDPALWARLKREAAARANATKIWPPICGCDVAASAVRAARANTVRAGMQAAVRIERHSLADCKPVAMGSTPQPPGLLVTNPPYGERLGDRETLEPLYTLLGDVLRQRFTGWTACVLTGNRELGGCIGLRSSRRHILYNGAIECRLLVFPISSRPVQDAHGPRWRRT